MDELDELLHAVEGTTKAVQLLKKRVRLHEEDEARRLDAIAERCAQEQSECD